MSTTPDELFLDALLDQDEGGRLEFKQAANGYSLDKAIEYCAALANEGGGYLIFGVTDKRPREVTGSQAFRDPNELARRVYEKTGLKVVPREIIYKTRRALVLPVPRRIAGVPVGVDGKFLMRAGESLVAMTAHELERIFAENKMSAEDEAVLHGLTAADIELLLDLDRFFEVMPDTDPGDLDERLEALQRRSLIRLENGSWSLTVHGGLFLARDLTAFPSLAGRRIRFVQYSDTSRINAIREHIDARGYALSFEHIVELIQANAPVREIITGPRRETVPAYPTSAVREFLANALIHQDLGQDGVQLLIELFADRLEIKNAGLPLIDVTRFVNESQARNPNLAELMRLARYCEVRGSGVDRALVALEESMARPPSFNVATAATSVVVYNDVAAYSNLSSDEKAWAAFLHCCIRYEHGGYLTNASLRERFGLAETSTTRVQVSDTIRATVERGWIKKDPRVGNSRRDARYVPFFAG